MHVLGQLEHSGIITLFTVVIGVGGELDVIFKMPKVLDDSSTLLRPLQQQNAESEAMVLGAVAEG